MFDKYWQHAPRPSSRTLFLLLIPQLIICCLAIWLLSTCSVVYGGVVKYLSMLPISKFPENETKLLSSILIDSMFPENTTEKLYYSSMLPETTTEKLFSIDERTLIDLDDFRFTINHDPCNKTSPLLLILVHSATNNFRKRQVIRETWGRQRSEIIVLFVLGWSDRYQDEIIDENNRYMDIIQGNFMDTYRNLTYKHVMLLKWVTYRCTNAKNVLKVDDDVFVNIPEMIRFVELGLSPWGPSKLIMCNLQKTAKPYRSKKSKWYVTLEEYPGTKYPPYCLGPAILYSTDSIPLLYDAAQKEPYFWIDDVHVTGILAEKINITRVSLVSWILGQQGMKKLLNPEPRFVLGPVNIDESEIKDLHNLIVSGVIWKDQN